MRTQFLLIVLFAILYIIHTSVGENSMLCYAALYHILIAFYTPLKWIFHDKTRRKSNTTKSRHKLDTHTGCHTIAKLVWKFINTRTSYSSSALLMSLSTSTFMLEVSSSSLPSLTSLSFSIINLVIASFHQVPMKWLLINISVSNVTNNLILSSGLISMKKCTWNLLYQEPLWLPKTWKYVRQIGLVRHCLVCTVYLLIHARYKHVPFSSIERTANNIKKQYNQLWAGYKLTVKLPPYSHVKFYSQRKWV